LTARLCAAPLEAPRRCSRSSAPAPSPTPGTFTLNLASLLKGLDAALDAVERDARYADDRAATKSREAKAVEARLVGLGLLLIGQGRIDGVALTAQELHGGFVYAIDLRFNPHQYELRIGDVTRLAEWFPDSQPISFEYGRLRISNVPESMLDALLAKDAHAEV